MSASAIVNRIKAAAGRFPHAADGNIAVIFAIALLPVIGFVGAAVDYTRANNARSSMQAALDSTALMVSKDDAAGQLSAADLTARAQAYFAALYNNTDASNVAISATFSNNGPLGTNIQLTGSGTIATNFMRVAGFPNMTFNTASTAAWGTTKLRVAMALDNTGSMSDAGKMGALQTASKNLIDQLSASAQNPGDVYISIVPFANVVNLGTGYKNSGYIDWSNWSTSGSIEEKWTCGSKYDSKSKTMLCGSANNPINSWNGCVMDRTQDFDVQVTAPVLSNTKTYFPADQSSYCPTQITPLSYNWSSLKSAINAMTPSGGTNQPIGLVWAWQTLQQTSPFLAPGEDPNYTYKKAIILLSDGLNTMDRWYGNGSSWSSQVDARQKLLCDNIKAAGVTIYSIQVNTDGDPTSSVLQYCASGSANFFMLTSSSQVISTFNTIGTSLAKLRLAR